MLFYQHFFIDFKPVSPIQTLTCCFKSTTVLNQKRCFFQPKMGRKLKTAEAPKGAFCN